MPSLFIGTYPSRGGPGALGSDLVIFQAVRLPVSLRTTAGPRGKNHRSKFGGQGEVSEENFQVSPGLRASTSSGLELARRAAVSVTEEQPARPNRKFHQGDFGEKFNDEAISVLGVCLGVHLDLFSNYYCHCAQLTCHILFSEHVY